MENKEQPTTLNQAEQTDQNTTETYYGDLAKTEILSRLVQAPAAERDENWQKTFLDNLAQASFCCGDPQVITGPDGYPYFQLFLPEPNKPFECFVIDRMKDDFLLSSGFGVVINPTQNSADWVLSYGDILNLHLNKTFYTVTETPFLKEAGNEIISENEKVLIAQPSEALFPQQTRQLIAEFLKANGVESPKVLLMMRNKVNGSGTSQDIVFNLTPGSFENENIYNGLMQTISWFLPRHYSFIGMDEKSLGNGFMPL